MVRSLLSNSQNPDHIAKVQLNEDDGDDAGDALSSPDQSETGSNASSFPYVSQSTHPYYDAHRGRRGNTPPSVDRKLSGIFAFGPAISSAAWVTGPLHDLHGVASRASVSLGSENGEPEQMGISFGPAIPTSTSERQSSHNLHGVASKDPARLDSKNGEPEQIAISIDLANSARNLKNYHPYWMNLKPRRKKDIFLRFIVCAFLLQEGVY